RDEWDTNELRREGFRGFGFHFAVLPVFDFEDVDPLLSERVVRDGIAVQHEHTVRPLSNPELRRWFLDRKAPSRSTIDDGLALVEFLARIPGRIEERGGRRSDRGSQKSVTGRLPVDVYIFVGHHRTVFERSVHIIERL